MEIETTQDARSLIAEDWDRSGESRRAMNLQLKSEALTPPWGARHKVYCFPGRASDPND